MYLFICYYCHKKIDTNYTLYFAYDKIYCSDNCRYCYCIKNDTKINVLNNTIRKTTSINELYNIYNIKTETYNSEDDDTHQVDIYETETYKKFYKNKLDYKCFSYCCKLLMVFRITNILHKYKYYTTIFRFINIVIIWLKKLRH